MIKVVFLKDGCCIETGSEWGKEKGVSDSFNMNINM